MANLADASWTGTERPSGLGQRVLVSSSCASSASSTGWLLLTGRRGLEPADGAAYLTSAYPEMEDGERNRAWAA